MMHGTNMKILSAELPADAWIRYNSKDRWWTNNPVTDVTPVVLGVRNQRLYQKLLNMT